ncbi:MAG TPA: DUF4386 domain-containing protein [Thermoleophilaceae bacterium]|nr:DUF4386 domain-containing protein [Thermoleophilaceae bacterium]
MRQRGDGGAAPVGAARRTSVIFGVLYLATFVFSIGGVLLYDPVLHPADFMAGPADDTRVRIGLFFEVLLIVANIGTAVVIYPIFRRRFEVLSISYVAARLAECTFIAIGIVCLLGVVTLRKKYGEDGSSSLLGDARSLVAVRDWTFVLGPGFVVGVGNGLILGYLMYASGLMPRGLAILGLVAGPLICITGMLVVLDVIEKGGAVQAIATAPEFMWELSLGIYPIVKGFRPSPILEP